MFETMKRSLFDYTPISTEQYGITPSRPDPQNIIDFQDMSLLMQQSAVASPQTHSSGFATNGAAFPPRIVP